MSSNPRIARLQSGNVREAWPHESQSFTPWLFENLEELGQVVGMRLEPMQTEVAVDTFAADILARNAIDGSLVLIENQLETSDHSHLGQIMTYLAGLEAKTVVWVATDFHESHLSALEWLNEHTQEDYSFFAVRIRAVRIANSPFAALFEVLARPNNWDRRLQATSAARTGQSEIGNSRLEFWTAYVERVPGERDRSGEPTRLSNRWRVLADLELIISTYVAVSQVGIFVRSVRGGNARDVRNRLLPGREALEREVGARLGGDDTKYFLWASTPGDYKDRTQRDRLIEWLAQQANLYERELRRVLTQEA